MPYVVTKNHFPEHYVDWADVMTKTAAEFEFGATKVLYDEKTLPTLVLHTEFRPGTLNTCLLYTSPSPRDRTRSRMPSSA